MARNSFFFFAFFMLIFVLAISDIAQGKLCEKPSKTWSGKCDNKKCDKQCIDWEKATHGACHKREAKDQCFCYFSSCDKSKSPPTKDGSSPPPNDGSSPPPPGGGSPPPSGGGSPPPTDGGSSPPPAGGSPPPAGGSPSPPADEGSPAPPTNKKPCQMILD